jgi:hypothetical protein
MYRVIDLTNLINSNGNITPEVQFVYNGVSYQDTTTSFYCTLCIAMIFFIYTLRVRIPVIARCTRYNIM